MSMCWKVVLVVSSFKFVVGTCWEVVLVMSAFTLVVGYALGSRAGGVLICAGGLRTCREVLLAVSASSSVG